MKRTFIKIITFLSILSCLIALPNQLKGSTWLLRSLSNSLDTVNPVEIEPLSFTFYGTSEGVSFFKDGIVFLSNSKYHHKMIPDHISFGETGTYFTSLDNPDINKGRPFLVDNSFPYLPESMSFTKNFSAILFTSRMDAMGPNAIEKIYNANIVSSGASQGINPRARRIELLPFCDDTFSYMDPTLSNNDSIMIFASDRTGTLGKLDLFIVIKQESEWADPKNLGGSINTKANEKYPFLDSENNLFFSSEGHSGFGGYDIYVCKFTGNGWGMPLNLTKAINGNQDEVAFSIHPDQQIGFFTVVLTSKEQSKNLFKLQAKTSEILSEELISQALVMYDSLYGEEFDMDLLAYDLNAIEIQHEPVKETITVEEPIKIVEDTAITTVVATIVPIVVDEEEIEDLAEVLLVPEPEEEIEIVVEPEPEVKDETVVFRVQILSSVKPKVDFNEITINGMKYSTFEYLYIGEYRYTIGNFLTVDEASQLQKLCRNSGYNQAFVAAFRNDKRVTDRSVFQKNK